MELFQNVCRPLQIYKLHVLWDFKGQFLNILLATEALLKYLTVAAGGSEESSSFLTSEKVHKPSKLNGRAMFFEYT